MGKIALSIVFIFASSSVFYWLQIRPGPIRHDCSWVKRHRDAIPERKGPNEGRATSKRHAYCKACPTDPPRAANESSFEYLHKSFISGHTACEDRNEDVIEKRKSQQYVPAKDWHEKADQEEHEFAYMIEVYR